MKPKKHSAAAPVPSPPRRDYSATLPALCVLFTVAAYLPALRAGFVNWDDDAYVTDNSWIHGFTHLKELLTSPVQGNYHPLTMLSLAFNYLVSGPQPWSYHLLNVVLHAANTFLVFRFAWLLSHRNSLVAFTTAILFGTHPMHVESVAWVSERKDVLYGFFFLLALISYTRHVDGTSRLQYVLSVVWFLFALLSKPAAVVFPLAAFTIDFLRRRPSTVKLFIEKIPYFLFAGVFGGLALYGQRAIGAADTSHAFSAGARALFACFGYLSYFLKLFFPVRLAPLYPFPPVNEPLPYGYWIAPLFFAATLALCVTTFRKTPVVSFGFAFYLVNLLLVLQFFIVGSAIIADRYTYLPYIGLFYIIGWLLDAATPKGGLIQSYAAVTLIALVLTIMTYRQAGAWESGASLWDMAIRNHPSPMAYMNRAVLLHQEGKDDQALDYYNRALELNTQAHDVLGNRGNIYLDRRDYERAAQDYDRALSLKPDYVPALDGRGAVEAGVGKYEAALADLNRALELEPGYRGSYKNRGTVLMRLKQFDKAIADFKTYLLYDPGNAEIHNAIGVCYQSQGKFDLALEPFNEAIRLNAQPVYYLNRSFSWNALGKKEEARQDALRARQNGLRIPEDYAQQLGI